MRGCILRSVGRSGTARTAVVVLALTCVAQFASNANAVEMAFIGPSSITITQGEAFTVDIALTNNSGDSLFGVFADVSGFARAGVTVLSGQTAILHFLGGCSLGSCASLPTANNTAFHPDDLSTNSGSTQSSDSLTVIAAFSLTPTMGDGSRDPGLDGALNEPSDRDVSLTLVAQTLGIHQLTLQGGYTAGTMLGPGGGIETVVLGRETLTVNVVAAVPEPTAVLVFVLGMILASTQLRGTRRAS